jgi:hypothetical protein
MTIWPYRSISAGDFEVASVALTAGSANTKGSYSAAISSTARNASGLIAYLEVLSATADYLLDIAIGAAGSEQVIAENLIFSGATYSTRTTSVVHLPISIKAGTRISCRIQSTTGSATATISISLINFDTRIPSYSKMTTLGANTADSGGISIDTGGVSGTYGSYTEISASISDNFKAIAVGIGNQVNNARQTTFFTVRVGIGAAGSEQAILYIIEQSSNAPNAIQTISPPFPIWVKSGSRLAVSGSSGTTDATDRLFDVILYGLS